MPRISLRAYEKQIEELIEQNRLQEAVDHCRYILMTYPKCISTYRILGKALLEGKQYNEAGDIFKRVLAVFPDDFIAHVGMSIIRENENNLDAAIWHMELAFDSQPSNITIQEELKRLFGRRDGTHPAKIRLTRGALVRMYARGELYPQAVAEIKSALVEDPKRLDLKVMLTKMYFLLSDTAEALTLCNELIVELPYCYEINKTLVAILPTTNKSEKTPIYQDRIKALNPYEEYVNEINQSEADVPDDQVMINQLDEIQPASTNENPNWVQTIESKWEEPTNLEALEWLPQANNESAPLDSNIAPISASEPSPTVKSSAEETPLQNAPTQEPADDQLPDWMRSAGWLPSEEPGSASEPEPVASAPGEPASAEPSGDLPDWLRSLATTEPETESAQPESSYEQPIEPTSQAAFTPEALQDNNGPIPENVGNTSDNDLPDWLKNFEVEGATESESKDDLPEWMKNIQSLEQTASPQPDTAPTTPDQLIDMTLSNETELPTPVSTAETDAFIHNTQTTHTLDPESVGVAPSEETLQPASTTLPDGWKSNLVEETPIAKETEDISDSGLPDWVRSVMDKMPPQEEQVNQTIQPEEPGSKTVEPDNISTDVVASDNVAPDEIKEIGAEADTPALNEKSGDDLLSWLRDLKPEESTASEENETIGNTGDLPVFEDDSPLDRLQQLTEAGTKSAAPEEQVDTSSLLNQEPAIETPVIETIAQPQEEAPEAESPSSLLDRLSQTSNSDNQPVEPIVSEIPVAAPLTDEIPDDISEQLVQLSQQILLGNAVDAVIKQLTILSSHHADNYLIWQLLGDAYAKIDNFSNALHAYDKAEELILKPQ